MSNVDYICCKNCGGKIVYDAKGHGREHLERLYGNPDNECWSVGLTCPDCVKALEAEMKEVKHDIGRYIQQASVLAEEVERLAELIPLAEEAADELEAYSLDKYPLDQHHFPSIKRGYDSDMLVVNRIRKAIGTEDQPQ